MNKWLIRFAMMQPAVYRGLIVSVASVLASLGVYITPGLPDSLIGLIAAISGIVTALLIRPAVTPNDKVLAYLPDPGIAPGFVMPGPATTTASDRNIIEAVRSDVAP